MRGDEQEEYIERDFVGFGQRVRYTHCPSCDTLLRQPYMSADEWDVLKAQWLAKYPDVPIRDEQGTPLPREEGEAMELRTEGLYRVSFVGGGSEYWRVVDMGERGISLCCLGVSRQQETILVDYGNVIIEATDAAHIGKPVVCEAFGARNQEAML